MGCNEAVLGSNTGFFASKTAILDSKTTAFEARTPRFDSGTAKHDSNANVSDSRPLNHSIIPPGRGPENKREEETHMARIKTRPDELRDQLNTASLAATAAGLAWPATAPTPAAITAAATAINTSLTSIATTEGTLATQRQTRDTNVTTGRGIMTDVDEATDFLYGADGAQKVNFGLPPKGSGSIDPLVKLTDIRTSDGIPAQSIFFDWENIQGATYEVVWATNSTFTTVIGTAVSTQSEYTITGLTAGTQYWMRVRPVRGGQFGPWSDPATRVAPA